MGIGPGYRYRDDDYQYNPTTVDAAAYKEKTGNPNPDNFQIVEFVQINNACVVMIKYPDCINFEGRKILVFSSVKKYKEMVKSKKLDPHFSNSSYSPVARFKPNEFGWRLAIKLAKSL